jgi:hypothetical protein
MPKIGQCYGIGQGLLPLMPPPIPFENAPTSNQDNYSVGQIVYTPGPNATNFYMYAGAGDWVLFATASGTIISVLGTSNQITVTTTAGVSTISLPSAITTPGSLTTTTSLSATTTVTGGTGVTATSGNVTALNGNFVMATPGNKLMIPTGSNASVGVSGSLSTGTVTISTNAVTPSSIIFYVRAVAGGTLGNLAIGSQTPGTGFTITSDNSADTSTINWWIIN